MRVKNNQTADQVHSAALALQALFLPARAEQTLRARYNSLSRLVPLLYAVLLANSWVLVYSFYPVAPAILTLVVPSLLTVVCLIRLCAWVNRPRCDSACDMTDCEKAFQRTSRLTVLLTLGFLIWTILLFPYGDLVAQSHIAFFLVISTLVTMSCLVHYRQAALYVAAIAGSGSILLLTMSNHAVFGAMAVNILIVVMTFTVLTQLQNRNFMELVEARNQSRARAREQARLLDMIEDMPVAVMTVDLRDWTINYANAYSKRLLDRIEDLLPIKSDTLIGTSVDVFHRNPEHQRAILSDPSKLPHNARIKLGDEVLELNISAVMDKSGAYLGPMVTWDIVTKEVEAEERILWLAHHDTLTGLPNRAKFNDELRAALSGPEPQFCLLFVDLDGFKLINDSLGHSVGDAILQQVAERLQSVCTPNGATVGRLGGDEFAVILPDQDVGKAKVLAEELIEALSVRYRLDDHRQVRISASVGISVAPEHARDGKLLLSRADIALSDAKRSGKSMARVFAPSMEKEVRERVLLEADLRHALEKEEGLYVFYQPILDIKTRKVTAREALIRWNHPQRGWVAPGHFIPIAEQSGLICDLGSFVLDRACKDAVAWNDQARVAVNVSPQQLGKGAFATTVLATLAESGLPPQRLEIEITETALLNEEVQGIHDLRQLHAMEVRVALDDFGTGYSSLAHLRAFPFDKIKIDGSFVRDCATRPDCAAVVRAVADLGKRLGVTTVAEGVETETHLQLVTEEGCSEVQGHYFGVPQPMEPIAAILPEQEIRSA